ncbi:MAG: DUF1648 domain-containing protein [Flavobacterium sp.]|nr:DUF1648 domain-containing protein [Flavobacterium sp.]
MARPVLKFHPTVFDKVLFISAIILLVAQSGITIHHYSSLPEIIPIHYNALGEVDGFGNKIHILILPLVTTLLFAIKSAKKSFRT